MGLKLTQKEVLRVLVENEDKWLGLEEIHKLSGIQRGHINSAIKFFIKNDYVYMTNLEGKVMVSPDGVSAYYSC